MYLNFYFIKIIKFLYTRLSYHFKSLEKTSLSHYYDWFLIKNLGSNHGRRLRYIEELSDENKKKYLKFMKQTLSNKKIGKNYNIYIGDSHAEFYGRNFAENNDTKNIFLSIWTGPTLLLSFCKSNKIYSKTIFLIKKIISHYGYKNNYNLILCFGEIDIRNLFYQILYVFNLKSEDELFEDYADSLKKIIEIYSEMFPDLNFYFYEIAPTTNIIGKEPTNQNEIDEISLNEKFPVLGNFRKRIYWQKKLCEKIKQLKNYLTYISRNKSHYNEIGGINKVFGDEFHITKKNKIIELQNEFKKKINENRIN